MEASIGLVAEARERQSKPLTDRELLVAGGIALLFIAAAAAVWHVVPWTGQADPLLVGVLVALYAVVSRVEFEVGDGYAVPEQLVFVPMLFLVPLPLVPLMVAAGFLLAGLPDYVRGRVRTDRSIYCLNDAWFTFGPVLVIGLLAPLDPSLAKFEIYVLAFVAQVAVGTGVAILRESLAHRVPVAETVRAALWSYRIDAVLSPVGLMVALEATKRPGAIAAIVPLVWLLHVFAQERAERQAASLELNQAYRGTVMLLSDVVEAEDNYTADHCRGVVELVMEVADELGVPRAERQELEFAALLHDVGKIAIPKEILNKPAKLTEEEFELIKTHTIEGQMLLDRVGGLLGRVGGIVRSCHERWDGKGYPDGLAGEDIPRAARIVFAADAYNAMTTDRPYRKALKRAVAVAELRENAGTQFDPHVVEAVVRVVERQEVFPRLAAAATTEAVAATLASAPQRASADAARSAAAAGASA